MRFDRGPGPWSRTSVYYGDRRYGSGDTLVSYLSARTCCEMFLTQPY